MARNFGSMSPADPLMIFGKPIGEPYLSRRGAFRGQQVLHESRVFLPREDNVTHEPASYEVARYATIAGT